MKRLLAILLLMSAGWLGRAEVSPAELEREYLSILAKAKEGDLEAQTQVGAQLMTGKGVEIDLVQAVRWFRGAAEKDHHPAQVFLGSCYLGGLGVPRDLVEGHAWWSLAEDMLPGLGFSLTDLEKQMTPVQIGQARERKRVLQEKIVKQYTTTPGK